MDEPHFSNKRKNEMIKTQKIGSMVRYTSRYYAVNPVRQFWLPRCLDGIRPAPINM